jgi:hypothetical protein
VIAVSIILTLVAGVVLVLLYLIFKPPNPLVVGLLLVVIVASAGVAIWYGAGSLSDREQPLVSLQAATDEHGLTTITIDVQANSLPTSDQVLVQLIGMTEFNDVVDPPRIDLASRPG